MRIRRPGVQPLPSPITQLLYVLPYNDYNLIPVNVNNIIKT